MKKKRTTYRAILHISLASFLLTGVACVTPGTQTTVTQGQSSPDIAQVRAEAYDGPKARIAVARFKNKTANSYNWWNPQIGDGMAAQLVTALFNSNRFIVLDREILADVLMEQDLGKAGRIKQETAAATGQIEGAELLVVAAVTEFEGKASGAGGGLGAYGGGILGAIAGGYSRAHMAIDLRIVDARTSRVLAATSVEGESTDVNLGGVLGGYVGFGALGGALAGWKNTPTEKALRSVINEAVRFIVSKTPREFFHYKGDSSQADTKTVPESLSAKAPPAASAPPRTFDAVPPPPAKTETTIESPPAKAPPRYVVREMQAILNNLGYNAGLADGKYGKKTQAGISQFQEEHGLNVTGQLDQATIDRLRELKDQGRSLEKVISKSEKEESTTPYRGVPVNSPPEKRDFFKKSPHRKVPPRQQAQNGRVYLFRQKSPYDFVGRNEKLQPDGSPDAQFRLHLAAPEQKIDSLSIRNLNGQPSGWDTMPGNQAWLMAVVREGKLINKSNGGINDSIGQGEKVLDLLVQDNNSIAVGKTNYELTITYEDGSENFLQVYSGKKSR